MAISVAKRNHGNSAATASITAAFTSNTIHNAIIVVAIAGTITNTDWNTAPTDTVGNVYATQDTVDATAFGGGFLIRVWANYDIKTSAGTNTVTVTNASNDACLFIFEVAGLASSNAYDKKKSNNQTSATALDSTNTVTTSFANELLLGIFANDSNSSLAYTLGTGYSNLQTDGATTAFGASEEKIVSATGTYNATATLAANSIDSVSMIFTFSDGVGGAINPAQYMRGGGVIQPNNIKPIITDY